jgi:hypothetical protein
MSKPVCDQKKNEWIEKIAAWEKSGLSVPKWCHQNHVNPTSFYRWLRKSKKSTAKMENRSLQAKKKAFVEIPFETPSEQTGIEIRCHSMSIRVEKAFDKETLSRVIDLLKEVS